MSQLSESRSRTAAARLFAVADRNLYRRNPFRVTGLPTTVTGRAMRERRQRDLGEFAPPPRAARLPLPEPPSKDQVREAYDELANAEHRVVAELFWLWGGPGDCGCRPEVHDDHDVAVLTHAAALDRPVDAAPDVASWQAAAAAWSTLLERDELWEHLRYRVRALRERRLDESTVDGLRGALPRALIRPLAATVAAIDDPVPLVPCFDSWPADRDTIDDLRLAAAGDTLERVTDLLGALDELLGAKQPDAASHRALTELAPAATRLEQVLPHNRFRRSSTVREQVAITLNNCGVALADPRTWRARVGTMDALFTRATEFAVTAKTRQAIARNRSPVDMLIARDRARSRGTPTRPATPYRPARPVRPARSARSGTGGLRRAAAMVGYLGAQVYLLAVVALAPPWLTLVATVVAFPVVGGMLGATRWPALKYLSALVVVVGLVAGVTVTRVLPADVLSVLAYAAAFGLSVAGLVMPLRSRR